MAIATEKTADTYIGVATGVPVNCDWPLFAEEEIEVIYGYYSLVAVLNVDYTVALAPTLYDQFTVTPLAALLTKINNLIAADTEGVEVNYITVRRKLPLLTDSNPTDARRANYLSLQFDRLVMMVQQMAEAIGRSIVLAPRNSGNSQIVIQTIGAPSTALVWDATGTNIEAGPTVDAIEGAVAAAATATAAAATATGASLTATGAAGAAAASAAAANLAAATAGGGIVIASTIPRIVIAGDSLTKNHLASGTFEGLLTVNPWNGQVPVLTNRSVVGRSLAYWLENYATEITPDLAKYAGKNIVIIEGGHNDYNAGYAANETAGRAIRLSKELRELGAETIIVTLASCGPAPKDAWRVEFNNYIMAEWHQHFDDVATFHLDPDMGPLGTYVNLTYFNADQNHYTLAGYTKEASYVQAALDRILVKHDRGMVNTPGGDTTSLAVGIGALSNQNTTGKNNVAIGPEAMASSLAASGNTAVGYQALNKSTDANNNAVLGYRSGFALTTGDSNVAVGHQSMLTATVAQANVSIGARSLEVLLDGNDNTAVGYHAGMAVTSGTGNILIGKNTADAVLQTGSNNTLIGNDLDTPAAGTSNRLSIDNVILGDKTKFLSMLGGNTILGYLENANFNSTADQAIPIQLPAGVTDYIVTNIWVMRPSVNLTTAVGGFYSTVGKGGTLIVAATQTYTAAAAANKIQRCVVANPGGQDTVLNTANLYLSLTTPQGVAATADVFILGVPVPT